MSRYLNVASSTPEPEAWWMPDDIEMLLHQCSGRPSGRFSHFCGGPLKFCYGDHWILGQLPDQGSSFPVTQFVQTYNSRMSPGGSRLLQFPIIEATVLVGMPKALEMAL